MPIQHKMKMTLKRYRPKVQAPNDVCSYADFIKAHPNPIQRDPMPTGPCIDPRKSFVVYAILSK